MHRRTFLSTMAGAGLAAAAPQAQTQRPNIVVLFADDLGYSDIGCFGGEIRTPNLDSLAKSGVRFTQFYNTARCCPSRASLLTGMYAHQAGVGHMVNPRPLPAYAGELNARTPTIAEVLKPAGYQTFMAGKWHVTASSGADQSKHNWPRQRGFDKFYGITAGAGVYFDPYTLTRDNEPIARDEPNYYITDAIASNAARYIEQASGPFFLYTAFTAPHWPLHALEPDIARYKGRYRSGWDALREERRERMVKMGIIDKRWPLSPRDAAAPAWKDAPDKEWQQRRMEVYAAQVDRMDQGIGRILDALRKKGQLDNTLVMFFADNGGCAEEQRAGTQQHYIAYPQKRGVKVEVGNRPGLMPGGEETFASYGLPWANASNTPFRLYKHWVHEGGIASPFVAHWPKGIPGRDKMTSQPAHLIDILPTCAELAGAVAPPVEGRSLVPGFRGGTIRRTEALYWEHEGNRAVRDGKWKLVSKHPGNWELYDIDADRCELNDVAAREPERASQMAGLWQKWAGRVGAEDWTKVQQARMPAAP
jgi:arylsulfatase A-like enzyme